MNTNDFPALYRAANKLAIDSQTQFLKVLCAHLVLLVIAALLSVINNPTWLAAVLQAACLLAALGLAIYLTTRHPDRTWYGARAAAESIKTVTWRFMARAEPFDTSDNESRAELAKRLKAIIDQNGAISQQLTSHLAESQMTARMLEVRALPLTDRHKVYTTERIDDQLDWYSNKAETAEKNSKLFFRLVIASNAVAVALALLRIRFPQAPYWPTDIFVAGSACLLSWIQARRFSELSSSYALTAHEISFIRMNDHTLSSDAGLSKFVGDTENAFSREHTQWIARKDEA